MELKLTEHEVKQALLQHVERVFPGTIFNSVHFDCSYGSLRAAELTYEAPRTEEQEARIAAVLADPTTDLNALTEALA